MVEWLYPQSGLKIGRWSTVDPRSRSDSKLPAYKSMISEMLSSSILMLAKIRLEFL